MPEVRVPVLRSIRKSLDLYLEHWARPIRATNGERTSFVVGSLLPAIVDFADKNPNHSQTFKPHVRVAASIDAKGRFASHNWRSLIAATNVVLGRVDLALRHGATIDDVLLAAYEREGVAPDVWTKEHGRREVVVKVPLEELIFG